MIDQNIIDAVKSDTDLAALVRSRGITLRKNGKNYKGLCPFHDDKTPSFTVNPDNSLWNCFGCGAGGDVIRFVELFDKVDFKEAVKRLSDNGFKPSGKPVKNRTEPGKAALENKPGLTPKSIKLFNRVIEFYHTAFAESPEAREYLNKRGITDNGVFADCKTGYANGTLLNVLPDDKEIRNRLKQIGILNSRGREHFYGCVTFPIYDTDRNPCGIYGRRIKDAKGSAPHLYLAGQRHGVFNWQAVKSSKKIILTESIIDAVTLISAGLKNVIPCYGVNGFTQSHISLFTEYKPEQVFICLDNDEPGQKASRTIAAALHRISIRTCIVNLPENQDINEFFLLTANAKDRFNELLLEADPEAKKAVKEKKEEIVITETGFTLTIEKRVYEVRGISKASTKLKATVKAIRQEKTKKRMHVDTIDFYSARSRAYLVKGLCSLFRENEQTITGDMESLTQAAENYQPEGTKETSGQKHEMTDREKAQALELLKNPDMFTEILTDFEITGYTGEEMNKLLCYVAAVSRNMENPLSVMIQSRSAAGKSSLQDAVLSLIPGEESVKYTRLTDQSLFYMEPDSLVHKILAIEELDGMSGAVYSIRSIQSSRSVTIAYTGKDPATGELKTQTNTVNGPLAVFITTTQVDIDGETASRFVFISIDESEAMTRKILAKQRESRTMDGMLNRLKTEAVIKKHKNANRLLKPVHVLNPYARLLTFSSKSIRARRDHTKYLNLIEAVTFLFQYQRKTRFMNFEGETIEYINVTLADIEKANTIANEVFGRSLDELTPPSKNMLALIREMVITRCKEQDTNPESFNFTRRDIREYSKWSDFQVKTHIKQLEELEYIYPAVGKKGKEYVYELVAAGNINEDKPFLIGLTDIRQLKKKANQTGIVDDLEG